MMMCEIDQEGSFAIAGRRRDGDQPAVQIFSDLIQQAFTREQICFSPGNDNLGFADWDIHQSHRALPTCSFFFCNAKPMQNNCLIMIKKHDSLADDFREASFGMCYMWVEKGDVCPMEYLIIFVGAVAAAILIFDLMNALTQSALAWSGSVELWSKQ